MYKIIVGENKNNLTVKSNGKEYSVVHDKYTGDWNVTLCDSNELLQEAWFVNRKSALNFVKQHSGLVDGEKLEYERAPERCI